MKKKLSVFLCVAAALFLGSCSDFSVSEEEKFDLPTDFNWEEYAEINKDVAMSQIILDIRKNKISDSTANCINLLSDDALAKKVYLEYAYCPEKGWFRDDKCTGLYANNNNYNKPVVVTSGGVRDTTGWTCEIAGCWRGGWNEISDKDAELKDLYADCTGDDELDWDKPQCQNRKGIPEPLETFIQDSVAAFTGTFAPIRMMCQFMPKAESREDAENYLKSFYYSEGDRTRYGTKFDATLVKQHYYYVGRFDGRPYKYCDGNIGEEKNPSLADKRGSGSGYYDYGKYIFCLNKENEKIYVIK